MGEADVADDLGGVVYKEPREEGAKQVLSPRHGAPCGSGQGVTLGRGHWSLW